MGTTYTSLLENLAGFLDQVVDQQEAIMRYGNDSPENGPDVNQLLEG